MADTQQMDRTYHFILESFVERGQAPHYTEIAREFSVDPLRLRSYPAQKLGEGLAFHVKQHPSLPVGRARAELVRVSCRNR